MLHNNFVNKTRTNEEGFTLIELLVVIIIIGVLAAIALPIFLNQQRAALEAHAKSDIRQIQQSIELGRVKTNKTLIEISGSTCTSCAFGAADPLTLPKTHAGWVGYERTLKNISDASGLNVTGLLDGYGRPYNFDENEGEGGACANKDSIGVYKDPFAGRTNSYSIQLPFSKSCA